MRRLLPPSLVTVAVIMALLVAEGSWNAARRGDVLAIVAQVANWRQAFSGRDYGSLFGPESPFKHFWSLAIEEQFYLLFPALVAVTLRRSRRLLAAVIVVLMLTSLVLAHVGPMGGRYFRTDVRAFELLAGCLLALGEASVQRVGCRIGWVGVTGAGLLGTLALTVSTSNPNLFTTILPATTVLSILIIASGCVRTTMVSTVLSSRPLVMLGRMSYSVYLAHWPADVLVTGTAARLAATAVGSLLLYGLVERRQVRLSFPRALAASAAIALATSTSMLVGALLAIAGVRPEASQVAAIHPAATTVPSNDGEARPALRSIVVLGDSTGEFLGKALAKQPGVLVTNLARRGCPLLDHDDLDVQLNPSSEFASWREMNGEHHDCNWSTYVDSVPAADVILVVVGPTMLVNYSIDGEPSDVTQPAASKVFADSLSRLSETLATRSQRLVFVTSPESAFVAGSADLGWFWGDRSRADAWNAIERQVAADHGAEVIEYHEWFDTQPDRHTFRPDGAHLEGRGADLSAAWILGQIAQSERI